MPATFGIFAQEKEAYLQGRRLQRGAERNGKPHRSPKSKVDEGKEKAGWKMDVPPLQGALSLVRERRGLLHPRLWCLGDESGSSELTSGKQNKDVCSEVDKDQGTARIWLAVAVRPSQQQHITAQRSLEPLSVLVHRHLSF